MQAFIEFFEGLPFPKRLVAYSANGTVSYVGPGMFSSTLHCISTIIGMMTILISMVPVSKIHPSTCIHGPSDSNPDPVSEFSHRPGDWLIFGCEASGLPEAFQACIKASADGTIVRIPMGGGEGRVRSLNLAVTAGVATYEAIRQLDAPKP